MEIPVGFSAFSGAKAQGLIFDYSSTKLLSSFNGNSGGFQNPHDLAVTDDGNTVYVIELNPFKAWKLTNGENGGVRPHDDEKVNQGWLDMLFEFFG